ncbi:DNA sulfur modification protein DndE [Sphingopyxis sp.]|uniref:DNA sulfur modification protein DndE n=1 Tax=Sphingopyxis sp. TaxID=1908224 RepID=UPI002DF3D660|nr:DNA sulfur modification protein DndE [Sphingopyxis sp.]
MRFNKLNLSVDATSKLRSLQQRTGLTPNLLCRIAAMVSLEDGPIGDGPIPDQEGKELNAYTLTGDFNSLLGALVRFVETPTTSEPLNDDQLLDRFRAHIHRGVGTLSVRARTPADLARLVAEAA